VTSKSRYWRNNFDINIHGLHGSRLPGTWKKSVYKYNKHITAEKTKDTVFTFYLYFGSEVESF
jgi:hypothetical protein